MSSHSWRRHNASRGSSDNTSLKRLLCIRFPPSLTRSTSRESDFSPVSPVSPAFSAPSRLQSSTAPQSYRNFSRPFNYFIHAPQEQSPSIFLAEVPSRSEKILSPQVETIMTMDNTLLPPPAAVGTKFKQMQQAREMQEIVEERARRSGDEPPPYDFLELIGKGSFGRVFKRLVYSLITRATGFLLS